MARDKKTLSLPLKTIRSGFEDESVDLRIDQIIAVKSINGLTRKSPKYLQIKSSIEQVGLIEPPAVFRDPKLEDKYILLDGHLRIDVLKEIGETEVTCLISRDDEGYTYNKHINRVATIQEHRMIQKAIERGVSEERLAAALNVDLKSIIEKRDLLDGICPEAVELLKDKQIGPKSFRPLRSMSPLRQIEVANLMNDSGVYTQSYALALLAATPPSQLLHPQRPRKIRGLDEEKMARMEAEMESLQREFRLIEESYAVDVMTLTFAKGYLAALLNNPLITRYLGQNHADFLDEFQKIVDIGTLAPPTA